MKNEIIKESNLSWIASSYCTGHTSESTIETMMQIRILRHRLIWCQTYRRSIADLFGYRGFFVKKYAYQKGEINSRYLIILCTDDIVVYGN